MCLVESATEEEKDYECESVDCDEEASKWSHECMNDWGGEVITRDDQHKNKCTENGEMSPERIVKIRSCQTYDDETEIGSPSDEQSRYPHWLGQAGGRLS